MDAYAAVKTLHILSATILFGTGIGIAFFFWMGGRSHDDRAAYFAAGATVTADLVFTASAFVLQPLSGVWLVWQGGFDPLERWLVLTYVAYACIGACWLAVVWIQLRIRNMLRAKLAGETFDERRYRTLRRWWFALGWPAFIAMLFIVHLMVAKPS